MQRIHFTASDLARTRLKNTAGPEAESALALELLGRGAGAAYRRWRHQVHQRLRERPGLPASPPARADMWRAAVGPYWTRLLAYGQAECDARGRIVMSGGVEQLLATLHPRITWNAQVLEIPDAPDGDVFLDGRGLVLCPSVFLGHRPARLHANGREVGQAVLVFSAPPDAEQASVLWDEPEQGTHALGALVGQTRAAALRELRATCTTSQLADRLGISAPCASQHTAVLRQSGLITTRRVRNTVLHSVTPLGVALLDGKVLEPAVAASRTFPQSA
ncbi:winged helix-turn-helix domain-containing protein [Streptomyces sp. ET3-23]|uniref:ArsR/SmtB family transcription factor n=1 Tax=Streptomyces sp. ET3-23 TaxID=2885643 RepID=UPI001D0F9DC7|nr:winged helix-turn-helix domain-containing protein [Streptomyces sp. ET3-23]MCC2274655.1 winged helix-turn-helix domain-containing protein [Streptomyces sp. ET3-23]